ncbi:MAG: hypothetical protein FWF81_05610 [Defluviitaleaceae bacterium]|nr:hypothetical protein [Defluviitaleaceae bacterium]
MFIKKILTMLFSLLFILTSCSESTSSEYHDAFAEAVEEGIIMDFMRVEQIVPALDFAPAEIRDLYEVWGFTTDVDFFVWEALQFEHDREFGGLNVSLGEVVSAGDVLAYSVFEPTEIFLAQHRLAQRELALFEENFIAEGYTRQIAMDELRLAVELNDEWERFAIELAILELEYEQFETRNLRTMEDMRRRIANTEEYLANEQLIAPFDGVVTHIGGLAQDELLIIVSYIPSMHFTLPASHMHIVRYGDVFEVTLREEYSFYAKVVSDAFAARGRAWQPHFALMPLSFDMVEQALYSIEYQWNIFIGPGMLRRAHPRFNMYGEGIVVPNTAVRIAPAWTGQDYGGYYVHIYEDGVIGRRFVSVGYTSGGEVLIISGIEPGQMVVGAR